MKLLIATRNQGKLKEYRLLLQNLPFTLTTLKEEGLNEPVAEGSNSFEENARLKAVTFARQSGLLTLADDSGLEVDALDGEPGPRSSRYAGEGASDAQRIRYLLARLRGIPWERRTARFRCFIAVAPSKGEPRTYSGQCQGVVAFEPRGQYGFGYDPIFYLPRLAKHIAELPPELKNRISHRARAARRSQPYLLRLAQGGNP